MDQKYLKRTIMKESIASTYLDVDKKALVYLPPNFDKNKKYPALFLHDGDDYFSLGRIATQANQLIDKQEIHPIIMIAIPVDKKLRSAEYSPIGSRNHLHINFMTEELLPFINERYPIKMDHLVVGGSSLGATVSVHMAIEHPSIWNNVLAQSGAFFPKTIEKLMDNPRLDWLTVYQSIGLRETNVSTHLGNIDLVHANKEVESIFHAHGANVKYEENNGDHTWGFWQSELPHVLTFFFGK